MNGRVLLSASRPCSALSSRSSPHLIWRAFAARPEKHLATTGGRHSVEHAPQRAYAGPHCGYEEAARQPEGLRQHTHLPRQAAQTLLVMDPARSSCHHALCHPHVPALTKMALTCGEPACIQQVGNPIFCWDFPLAECWQLCLTAVWSSRSQVAAWLSRQHRGRRRRDIKLRTGAAQRPPAARRCSVRAHQVSGWPTGLAGGRLRVKCGLCIEGVGPIVGPSWSH